ncbi:hypothetical protein [Psychrobacter sp. K31L]|uniref:hypothetical protein n=1 Tax=Psychrobacter sp. K31L TaxID=2820758 RepID=UPI001B31FA9F|nr:hypothetical protein [Psychrobacter sp. K31L]MBP3946045.1 hypothetical protein [Psychrobacter sp. K31L]
MPNSIRTTSNTQTTTNSKLAHQAFNGSHDDGLSIVTPLIQREVIETLVMTCYGKEGSQ